MSQECAKRYVDLARLSSCKRSPSQLHRGSHCPRGQGLHALPRALSVTRALAPCPTPPQRRGADTCAHGGGVQRLLEGPHTQSPRRGLFHSGMTPPASLCSL